MLRSPHFYQKTTHHIFHLPIFSNQPQHPPASVSLAFSLGLWISSTWSALIFGGCLWMSSSWVFAEGFVLWGINTQSACQWISGKSLRNSYWWFVIMTFIIALIITLCWLFFGVECYQTWCSRRSCIFYQIYGHRNMTELATPVASAAPFSSQHHIWSQLFHRFDYIDLHLQNGWLW